MKIKVNDELMLKNDCFVGKKGDVFKVENVTDEYITVKREYGHKTATVSFTRNFVDELFECVQKNETEYDDIVIEFDDLVNAIIENSDIVTNTVFDNCFVMSVKLPNGYVIVESHTFEDTDEYNEELAYDICISNVYEKVLELERYATMHQSNVEILYGGDADCDNCPDVDECPYA